MLDPKFWIALVSVLASRSEKGLMNGIDEELEPLERTKAASIAPPIRRASFGIFTISYKNRTCQL